jgi:hypothetical protein
VGDDALYNLDASEGDNNTATGFDALYSTTIGYYNTATGASALFSNTTGYANVASGITALYYNTTGEANTAVGSFAMIFNTTGNFNTAVGDNALFHNSTGSWNIALGFNAGTNLKTGSNNVEIGNPGRQNDSGTIRIGTNPTHRNTFIAGISGATVPSGVAVIVGTDGHLGTITSSKRFKDAIEPMDQASETIFALKPVTFRYKKDLDPEGIPQFGLVAEQVEKINPDLVARDDQGKPYTVRYDAVNAMLLNEFLKEHRKVEEQGSKMQALEATVAQQQKEIKALSAQIQKVSAQIEVSKTAPLTVGNNQ